MNRTASLQPVELLLREPTAADDRGICDLFDATIMLGAPLPFELARGSEYRRLCLGWYLEEARHDAAVVIDPGHNDEVVGYALVCTDEASYGRSIRRAALRFVLTTFVATLLFRLDAHSRGFYADRLRYSVHLARLRRHPAAPAHAHLNVRSDRRSGSVALMLRDHIDDRCRTAGITAWSGEINAPVGRRRQALARLGLAVVSHTPNHTLSRRLARPVERLVTLRNVSPRAHD